MDHLTRLEGPTDRVERPKSIRVRTRLSRLAEDQLPTLVLICPGTTGEALRDGDGNYKAQYSVGVAAVTQSTSEQVGREQANVISTAAALLLMQCLTRASESVTSVVWEDDSSDDTDIDDQRSRHVFTHTLTVTVDDVMNDEGFPSVLDGLNDPLSSGTGDNDLGSYLTVESTELTITPVETIE
jgi:hypothetical protein